MGRKGGVCEYHARDTDRYLCSRWTGGWIGDLKPNEIEDVIVQVVEEQLDSERGLLTHEKIGNFIKRFRYLEDILASRYLLKDKFYRDHLMHVVRVMLLSHAIGRIVRLGDKELKACTLAGLFHDLALPLSEARETFDVIQTALGRCYTYVPRDKRRWPKLNTQAIRKHEFWGEITKSIEDPRAKSSEHGLLGAFEFLEFFDMEKVKKHSDVKETLLLVGAAMAKHDYKVGANITYSKDPVSTILVLADEMQDWGRPVGKSRNPLIPNIFPFDLTEKKILATIDYSKCPNRFPPPGIPRTKLEHLSALKKQYFSPLLQIQGKQKNLDRLTLDTDFPETCMTYKLPLYQKLSSGRVLQFATKTKEYVDRLFKLVPELQPADLEHVLLSGGGIAGTFIRGAETQTYVLVSRLWSKLYDSVVQHLIPRFNLFYEGRARELVISTQRQMPRKISVHKNREGRMEWNYRLNELNKNYRIRFDVARTTIGLTYELQEKGKKVLRKLEKMVGKKNRAQQENAGCYAAFLQLLFLVRVDVEYVAKRGKKNGGMKQLHEDLLSDDEWYDVWQVLAFTGNEFDFRFFLLSA